MTKRSSSSAPSLSQAVGTQLLFENGHARVWLLKLEPGQATEWHTHEYDYVFVVTQAGQVQTEYVDGRVERQDDDPVGATSYRRVDPGHRLVNVGASTYQNVVVELKRTNDRG